jgi:hypothetical protein
MIAKRSRQSARSPFEKITYHTLGKQLPRESNTTDNSLRKFSGINNKGRYAMHRHIAKAIEQRTVTDIK